MILLPYDLTFTTPLYLHRAGEDHKLESKAGLIIKIERDDITSFADVSPLTGLNSETYKDVHTECQKIDTNKIFHDIESFLKSEKEKFLQEQFLDFDFSRYTQLPSLKHGLSCLFSDYYRQKFGIKITGDVYFHGLVTNTFSKSTIDDSVKKAVSLEKAGFEKAKIKIGTTHNTPESLAQDNLLLNKILSSTQHLQLRLDANRKFALEDFDILLKDLDFRRIDYIEEPVKKTSDLIHFTSKTKISIAIDENIHLMKDIIFDRVSTVIIKPTVIGDYYTIKRLIEMYDRRGISPVISSSLESQVGIFQIAQLAHIFNPKESHGLDTFDCYLEKLMDLDVHKNTINLKDTVELLGPRFV